MQALIVSVVTFSTIYFVATKVFKLDNRFAATLGAGGSVCGVSASIAIGGARRASLRACGGVNFVGDCVGGNYDFCAAICL